jgi:hypothetical protein
LSILVTLLAFLAFKVCALPLLPLPSQQEYGNAKADDQRGNDCSSGGEGPSVSQNELLKPVEAAGRPGQDRLLVQVALDLGH